MFGHRINYAKIAQKSDTSKYSLPFHIKSGVTRKQITPPYIMG